MTVLFFALKLLVLPWLLSRFEFGATFARCRPVQPVHTGVAVFLRSLLGGTGVGGPFYITGGPGGRSPPVGG